MGAYGTPPKPDGFRFGSVNRPSPPHAIYRRTSSNANFVTLEMEGQITKKFLHSVHLLVVALSSTFYVGW